MSYQISDDKKNLFAGIYLLDFIINNPKYYSVYLENEDVDLEPVLEWLMAKDFIIIDKKNRYIPVKKGRDLVKQFMQRYSEFLKMFDVYCCVDLEVGDFAFSHIDEFSDEKSWKEFLADSRWDDLRIAVCEFKGIDPVEIVFMSFINEGRFGRNSIGWQFDLLLGSIWDDILEICDSAIHINDLGYEDSEGVVEATAVIEDIVAQGSEIMLGILESEDVDNSDVGLNNGLYEDEADDEFIVETVYIDYYDYDYYRPYYDPFYISPIWFLPFVF